MYTVAFGFRVLAKRALNQPLHFTPPRCLHRAASTTRRLPEAPNSESAPRFGGCRGGDLTVSSRMRVLLTLPALAVLQYLSQPHSTSMEVVNNENSPPSPSPNGVFAPPANRKRGRPRLSTGLSPHLTDEERRRAVQREAQRIRRRSLSQGPAAESRREGRQRQAARPGRFDDFTQGDGLSGTSPTPQGPRVQPRGRTTRSRSRGGRGGARSHEPSSRNVRARRDGPALRHLTAGNDEDVRFPAAFNSPPRLQRLQGRDSSIPAFLLLLAYLPASLPVPVFAFRRATTTCTFRLRLCRHIRLRPARYVN
jgi:hypothetical protein